MKDKISKINISFIEKLALSIFGLLAGIILSKLLRDSLIDYFSLFLIFILTFLYIYYKHSSHVENISIVLTDLYSSGKGDIQYFDNTEEFYKTSSEYILKSTHEVLIYNDYFGQEKPPMGFDTSDNYYSMLEKKLNDLNDFKYSCIISANTLSGTKLSERYKEHLNFLFDIIKNKKSNIKPFAFANQSQRPLYFSFTIIDNNILRIPLRGIVDNQQDKLFRPAKIIGGLIIKDNIEIINHFREKFKNTEQLAIKYNTLDEIINDIV